MSKFDKYFEAVAFLEGLSNIKVEQDYMKYRGDAQIYLDRTRYFLNLIGNPQNEFKIVHVTGTAGKGSVSNMMQSVLTSSGKKTGLFTSPYTTTSIEKIKAGDLYIDPLEFAQIVEDLKPFINQTYEHSPYRVLSYFEIFMGVAFEYFRRLKCEYVVLEVGMGGRFDASNVVDDKEVAVITNIDYDHMNLLGNTLEEIAYDKAGIINTDCEFFTGEKREELREIFRKECEKSGANYNQIELGDKPNEELVSAVARYLEINDEDIQNGIEKARLQCRLEVMQENPKVIIDGAHNRVKIEYLINKLKNIKYNKLHLVIGAKAGKNPEHIFGQILPIADFLYATRYQKVGYFPGFESRSPVEILELADKYNNEIPRELHIDPNEALKSALAKAKDDDLVLITGSLYLCGELRSHWIAEEFILENRTSFKS